MVTIRKIQKQQQSPPVAKATIVISDDDQTAQETRRQPGPPKRAHPQPDQAQQQHSKINSSIGEERRCWSTAAAPLASPSPDAATPPTTATAASPGGEWPHHLQTDQQFAACSDSEEEARRAALEFPLPTVAGGGSLLRHGHGGSATESPSSSDASKNVLAPGTRVWVKGFGHGKRSFMIESCDYLSVRVSGNSSSSTTSTFTQQQPREEDKGSTNRQLLGYRVTKITDVCLPANVTAIQRCHFCLEDRSQDELREIEDRLFVRMGCQECRTRMGCSE